MMEKIPIQHAHEEPDGDQTRRQCRETANTYVEERSWLGLG
jgi:hypothetical protein